VWAAPLTINGPHRSVPIEVGNLARGERGYIDHVPWGTWNLGGKADARDASPARGRINFWGISWQTGSPLDPACGCSVRKATFRATEAWQVTSRGAAPVSVTAKVVCEPCWFGSRAVSSQLLTHNKDSGGHFIRGKLRPSGRFRLRMILLAD